MSKVSVKISAKNGSSTRKSLVWGIALPVGFVNDTIKMVPRLRLGVDGDDLLIQLSAESGVLMNRPSTRSTSYYSSIGQGHTSRISIPFDTAMSKEVEGSYDSRRKVIRIKAKNLPPIMSHAIKQYRDLDTEVRSHIPSHSPEDFQQLVEQHKGGETIGDQQAIEAVFASAETSSYSDEYARKLKNQLEALMRARPDIQIYLDVNGRVTMTKMVPQEI